ncbi:hypothetical protein PsorP6_006114 [Peronosclerospora sorghi]|uniref:Uncharacterized protein n=1 Tax=Peronosclerospora sorghi TaxID=230839 RepID=A0ACC0W532_9STRA|nr:hypothetical protein PsorP6_006114 [Peronosclerospora sorghi]
MRQSRCREDEEDERVVYYELEANPHNRNLLMIPDDAHATVQSHEMGAAGDGTSHLIFPRQQHYLFNIDHSGDEVNEENPFDFLLQQQMHKKQTCANEETSHTSSTMVVTSTTPSNRPDCTRRQTNSEEGGKPIPILKQKQQPTGCTGRSSQNSKKLVFEAANSRPARWSARKPSAVDTKNRRKSFGAIQKRRTQPEAFVAKRQRLYLIHFERVENINYCCLQTQIGAVWLTDSAHHK